jgi:hypothetical protein
MPGVGPTRVLRTLGQPPIPTLTESPVLAVALASATAVTATVTVTGSVTVRLYYRKSTDSVWTAGSSRTGSGTISATGLTANAGYQFIAVVTSRGVFSLPSNVIAKIIEDPTAATYPRAIMTASMGLMRTMLSNSLHWQAACSESDAAGALRHILYYGVDHPGSWENAHAYTLKKIVRNGERIYECTVAGTSAATAPTWPTTIGATVTDGGVTWICREPYGEVTMGAIRALRPFCIIGLAEMLGQMIAGGSVNAFSVKGTVGLLFEIDTPTTYALSPGDGFMWGMNLTNDVLLDVLASAGAADCLDIDGFRFLRYDRVDSSDPRFNNEGDRVQFLYLLTHKGALVQASE